MGLKSPIDPSKLKLNEPVSFKLHVDRDLLEITKKKLSLARYPEEQSDFGPDDWAQGAKVAKVRELAEYWRDMYDWVKHEVSSSRLGAFTALANQQSGKGEAECYLQPLPS